MAPHGTAIQRRPPRYLQERTGTRNRVLIGVVVATAKGSLYPQPPGRSFSGGNRQPPQDFAQYSQESFGPCAQGDSKWSGGPPSGGVCMDSDRSGFGDVAMMNKNSKNRAGPVDHWWYSIKNIDDFR